MAIVAAIVHSPDADPRQVVSGPARSLERTTPTMPASLPAQPVAGTLSEDPLAPLAPLGPLPSRPAGPSLVASAIGDTVDVYSSPGSDSPTSELDNPQPSGAPLVMLVREQRPDWLRVLLPVRPNGSSGWVRRDQVDLYEHDFYLVIGLREHRITAFNGNSVLLDERIGLGAGGTPTPTGLFFIKELLQPPSAGGPYGPYAYGLSAFSEVLFSFGGGPGTVGIHGTNDPSSIGRNVSNGCIRMSNSGVTRLADTLPLGVPVQIRA